MAEAALQVDRYELFEPIARGGMATVYFARQRGAGGFSKAVAIKRMRPDLAEEREFVDLFVDEARLASRIRHANVVNVIDVVSTGAELLLVMEYLHGQSLSRLLAAASRRGEAVPPNVAVAIAADVLHGLHAAHSTADADGKPLGIVHRDVSPQNVLVGADGVARLVDFGIARASGQLHATDEGKTRGKAAYSSPEQLRGAKLNLRSDVFSTMIVLWETLVGRSLFEGETPAATLSAVLSMPIDPPGLHIPTLPQALDDAIMVGLERDASARPETASDMAVLLEKALPPASPAEVAAWVRSLASAELAERTAIVDRIESGVQLHPPVRSRRAPYRSRAALSLAAVLVVGGAAFAIARGSSPTRPSPPVVEAARVIPTAPAVAGEIATATTRQSDPPATAASAANIVSAAVAGSATTRRPVVAPRGSSTPSERRIAASTGAVGSPSSSASAQRPPIDRCDPPYVLDSIGHKVFKPECL